jgi:hypothetical protein
MEPVGSGATWTGSPKGVFAGRKHHKPRQGVVASTLGLLRNGAVGFIDWLDLSDDNDTVLLWRKIQFPVELRIWRPSRNVTSFLRELKREIAIGVSIPALHGALQPPFVHRTDKKACMRNRGSPAIHNPACVYQLLSGGACGDREENRCC